MKPINILEEISEYKITTQDLQNIEKIKNCALPSDYANFLLTHNGGEPYWDSFEIKNYFPNSEPSADTIRLFYGICLDNKSVMYNYDIFDNVKCYDNRIPKELLPIATDSFGNNVCISVNGINYGKIYFWDHENEGIDENQEPWWKNIYLIANSFTEFLNGLYKFDIDENDNEISTFQDGKREIKKAKKSL